MWTEGGGEGVRAEVSEEGATKWAFADTDACARNRAQAVAGVLKAWCPILVYNAAAPPAGFRP